MAARKSCVRLPSVKKLEPQMLRYLVRFLPSRVLATVKIDVPTYTSRDLEKVGLQQYQLASFSTRAIEKNQFQHDDLITKLLRRAGFDVATLKTWYDLTPVMVDGVYKDYAKYYIPREVTISYKEWVKGAQWYLQFKMKMRKKFDIMNYDEVVKFIDRSKSPTALMAPSYKTKGECLDDEDFRKSFVIFVWLFVNDEELIIPWKTTQKFEIRPTAKINEHSVRSFVIGSIYALLLNHMMNLGHDLLIAENWNEMRTGMGMSLFQQDYHQKVSAKESFKCHGYYDVPKWDSNQHHWWRGLEVNTITPLCKRHFVKFYDLLGSLAPIAKELGYANIDINCHRVRHQLLYHETIGPVILPRGELCEKERGKNSGDGRTTPQNVGDHKIIEFTAARKVYGKHKFEKYLKENHGEHTGDDNWTSGENFDVFDEVIEQFKKLGVNDIEYEKTDSIYNVEYLSSRPIKVEIYGKAYYMPQVNSSKIIASLASKMRERNPILDLARINAALILCKWTEDYPLLENVRKEYLEIYPSHKDDSVNFTNQQILELYLGRLESLPISDFCFDGLFSEIQEEFSFIPPLRR